MTSILLSIVLTSIGAFAQVYPLNGTDANYGPYSGSLEVRAQSGGDFQVVRAITYSNFTFEGFRVQEVWKGSGQVSNGHLKARFFLKKADLYNQVDQLKRSREDFLTTEPRVLEMDLDPTAGKPLSPSPFWSDLREYRASAGKSLTVMGEIAQNTLLWPIMHAYANDAFVRRYADRPEYQSRTQYFVFDPTDFDFLRAHPDTIRVDNKITDTISMTEAASRHDAYAIRLQDKAEIFDRDLLERHLNSQGLYVTALYDRGGNFTGTVNNGDAGLWSGMYAASQAMRFLATGDPLALANFKRSLHGILRMMDITGDPREFARTVMDYSGGATLGPLWHVGTAPFQNLQWLEGGNNDMIKGVFLAFAWAFKGLPVDDPLRTEVADHAKKLPELKVVGEINHPHNLFLAYGLEAIATQNPASKESFVRVFDWGIQPVNALGLDNGFYYGGIADWSGINLGMVSRVTDILIADQVAKTFPGDRKTAEIRRHLQDELMNMWKIYAGARRGFVTVAAYAFGQNHARLDGFEGLSREALGDPEMFANDVADATWSLREIPIQRSAHSVSYDYSWRPDWSVSAWPNMPWKSLGESNPMDYYYQGAYGFPVFEGAADSDNYWTDGAFRFRGGNSPTIRHGRVDYLFTYWMGRLAGLFEPGV